MLTNLVNVNKWQKCYHFLYCIFYILFLAFIFNFLFLSVQFFIDLVFYLLIYLERLYRISISAMYRLSVKIQK